LMEKAGKLGDGSWESWKMGDGLFVSLMLTFDGWVVGVRMD